MDTILGPVDLKNLQLAYDKLGWSPPESAVIVACLRGDPRLRGKALQLEANVRLKWVEELWRAEGLDRKEQAAVYNAVRTDLGEWLDHFSRGGDKPKGSQRV